MLSAMGLFKSEEERLAAQAERERVEAARQVAQAEQDKKDAAARAFAARAASPVGRAELAHEAGHRFFEIQLDVSQTQGTAFFGEVRGNESRSDAHLGVLGEIEAVGWRLEHAGYVFVETGQESTDKFVSTGQRIAVTGKTVGIYLFRRAEA
ncbi:hypothetical protein ASD11_16730 [Aeromicrobium sp. Root495]|nr:hypothetical protein ASD11_16730 [Aeromicrobium sp. Root495]